jgi:type II secretory ATPase GspE/PulE/Tfp pilus assembly ATPase PilB-like protein
VRLVKLLFHRTRTALADIIGARLGVAVKYRIDIVLQHRHAAAARNGIPVLSRIKCSAIWTLRNAAFPDGRFRVKYGRFIDLRVSISLRATANAVLRSSTRNTGEVL